MAEREMSAWLNEDYHAYNECRALIEIQKTNFEIANVIGDMNDDLLMQTNSFENKINDLKQFIFMRRNKKTEMFSELPADIEAVMNMHYMSYKTFEEISEVLNYHVSSVKRKHLMGLEMLTGGTENGTD